MNIDLTEEQVMIKDLARKFAEREIIPLLTKYERNETICFELNKKIAEAGLLGIRIPKEYGGAGLDPLTSIIVAEQLGWGSVSLPSLALNAPNLPGVVILENGTEEQKQKYLPPMCRGELSVAMAITEDNAGSDVSGVKTRAFLDGDYWVVDGTKSFCSGGWVADTVLVLARTDTGKENPKYSIIAVDKGTPGFSGSHIEGKLGFRATPWDVLSFTDCRVPRGNLIGEEGNGLRASMAGVNVARLEIAAAWVGIAQSCLESCIKYAKERNQFGKPIGSYQLVQGTIAEMSAQINAARCFTYFVAELVAKKAPRVFRQVAEAKLFATEMAIGVATEAMKLHGAGGLVDDMPVEHHFRDVLAGTIAGGTSNTLKLTIGKELIGIDARTR